MPDTPAYERLPLTSADPIAPRLEELKSRLPEVLTDGQIDLEKLSALLGRHAASGPERYGLSWAGKAMRSKCSGN